MERGGQKHLQRAHPREEREGAVRGAVEGADLVRVVGVGVRVRVWVRAGPRVRVRVRAGNGVGLGFGVGLGLGWLQKAPTEVGQVLS